MRRLLPISILLIGCSRDGLLPTLSPDAALDLRFIGDAGDGNADLGGRFNVSGCGNLGGLQAEAPWPMVGYCPTRQGRSPFNGPQTGAIHGRTHVQKDAGFAAPIIDKQGFVFLNIGFLGGPEGGVLSIDPHGGASATVPESTGTQATGALAADGTYVVVSGDGQLHAWDRRTGKKTWSHSIGTGGRASPVIDGDGNVYACGAGVFSFSSKGEQRWHVPSDTSGLYLALDESGNLYTTFVGLKVELRARSAATGELRWSTEIDDSLQSPAASGGSLYLGGLHGLQSIDARTGKARWFFETGARTAYLPAIGTDGAVFVGTEDGRVFGIDPVRGEARWTFHASSGMKAPPVVGADDTVYVGTLAAAPSPNLYAIDGRSGALRWSASLDGPLRASPGIGADGLLYVVADPSSLYAIGP